jgi:RHS repeat-associated protein
VPIGVLRLSVSLLALVVSCGLALAASAAPPDQAGPPYWSVSNAQHERADRERELWETRRASPAAKAARDRSRHVLANAPRAEAVEIARDEFEEILLADVSQELPLADGDRIEDRVGPFVLQVDREGVAADALVESSVPLQAPDEEGTLRRVELALDDRGDYLESKNPIVPVRYSKDPREGVLFEQSGFRVMPVGTPGLADAEVTEIADKPFFANVATDSDMWFTPKDFGTGVSYQLRSAASPERMALAFDIPADAELRLDEGLDRADVVREGKVLTTVTPPAAVDADGAEVPVRYEVSGRTLSIEVDHRGGDFLYPILVDPFIESWDWQGGYYNATGDSRFDWHIFFRGSGQLGDWRFLTRGPFRQLFGDGAGGRGLYVWNTAYPDTTIQNGNWGEWNLDPWRTTVNIPQVDYQISQNLPHVACSYTGIWGWDAGWGNSRQQLCPWDSPSHKVVSGWWRTACFAPGCSQDGTPDNTRATFGIVAYGLGQPSEWNWALLGRTAVYYGDKYPPAVASSLGSEPWAEDDEITLDGTAAADWGIGLDDVVIRWGDGGTIGRAIAGGCVGIRTLPCPESVNFDHPNLLGEDSTIYSDDSPRAEGIIPVYIDAHEKLGRPTVTGHLVSFSIDKSGPDLSVSGSLKEAVSRGRLADGNYTVSIDARDGIPGGTNADARSGVASIGIEVDGVPVPGATEAQPCPSSNCPMSYRWTFNSERYAAGSHTVTVVAKDQVGNPSHEDITADVVHAADAEVAPGSVNLRTGGFGMTRTDVSADAIGAGFALSRTYNSRDLGADAYSPFGPGWSTSLPVDGPMALWLQLELIGASDSGVAEVTHADGDRVAFPRSDGSVQGPPGFEDLTLVRVTAGYELRHLGGDVIVFEQPPGTPSTGPGSNIYLPVELRTPSSSSAGMRTTVAYDFPAGGAPRVRRVTAAPPGNVSCTGDLVAAGGAARGCRALLFTYAPAGTPTPGTAPADFAGRLAKVELVAWNPATNVSAMTKSALTQYAYDSSGRLASQWDPRITPGLVERYEYDAAGNLTRVTPAGEAAWTLEYAAASVPPSNPGYVNDLNAGRLTSVSRQSPPAGTSRTTIAYNVPIQGSGAPYSMGRTDVAAWGQTAEPDTAVAIFPPDEVPSVPPASYGRAVVYYLDAVGRLVNRAHPGGRIATAEYDSHDNVVRELSPANRQRALAGTDAATRAAALDVRHRFNVDGTLIVEELGPLHRVKLSSGEVVDARARTQITYDEGAPSGAPFGLPTTTTRSAQVVGRPDADTRVTRMTYSGQGGLGWILRQPTAVTVDPGGLNLTSSFVYEPSTGDVTETRQPASTAGGTAHTRRLIYYSENTVDGHPECSNRAEWIGLVCKQTPAAQPGTLGMPALPVTLYKYDTPLNGVTSVTETTGAATRTTTTTYDPAGRQASVAVDTQGFAADPVPTVSTAYHHATGRPTTTTATTPAGTTTAVAREYDSIGRLTRYTDSDGGVTTTNYDLYDRPVSIADTKGTRTFTFDTTTGDLIRVGESGFGTISATYDADGQVKTQTLPAGLQERSTYDETGARVGIQYVKTVNCSANCTWQDSSGVRNIHGELLTQAGTQSSQAYTYDNAGRLTETRDTTSGGGCSVRNYSYDADSNRTALVTRPPAADGSCALNGSGTKKEHAYDAADRLTDTDVTYDSFGRITSLPSRANADKGSLAMTYYANDLTRSLKQGTTTKVFTLDAVLRQRSSQTIGGDAQTRIFHYGDDSDVPTWIRESTDGLKWTRAIRGVDGDLIGTKTEVSARVMLKNLHGDIVGEASTGTGATSLLKTTDADEFGVPKVTTSNRYAWLGGKMRSKEFATSGITSMGVRTYVPGLGRFTAPDPVPGGSANAYDYAQQDPVNGVDLDGRYTSKYHWHYSNTYQLKIEGREVSRILLSLFVSLNGRQARLGFRMQVLSGASVRNYMDIRCRREIRYMPDAECTGTDQKERNNSSFVRRWAPKWGSYYLRGDNNYHIDFMHRVDPRGYGPYSFPLLTGPISSPTIYCRERQPPCRF